MTAAQGLCALLLLIGAINTASSQRFRIPNDADSCNVVNLNFGRAEETSGQTRGPQGPPGIKGQKGEVGPRRISRQVKLDIVNTIKSVLGASSCDELMKIHGMREAGYYLMRSNKTNHALYKYCDFQLREGIASCRDLRANLKDEMKTGHYLINGSGGQPSFQYCQASCPLSYEGKCFHPIIASRANRPEAAEECQIIGGHLANIYSQAQMDDIMTYVRYLGWKGGTTWIDFHSGMNFNPWARKTYFRDGTYAPSDLKWYRNSPWLGDTVYDWTYVTLRIDRNSASPLQFLHNKPPGYQCSVLCET